MLGIPTLTVLALFWVCIYPSEKFCVSSGAFYEIAFCEPYSRLAIGALFYSLTVVLCGRPALTVDVAQC